jgi:amino acid permease
LALSLRRLWQHRETVLDVVVVAGCYGIAATFAIHVYYSYSRYAATGWLMDAYPRYYLPLIAIVPLACLSLAAAIETPRWRSALLLFLVGGPVLFRLFGAPLG